MYSNYDWNGFELNGNKWFKVIEIKINLKNMQVSMQV